MPGSPGNIGAADLPVCRDIGYWKFDHHHHSWRHRGGDTVAFHLIYEPDNDGGYAFSHYEVTSSVSGLRRDFQTREEAYAFAIHWMQENQMEEKAFLAALAL